MATVILTTPPLEMLLSAKQKHHKEKRWLDEGSIVTFDVLQVTAFNVELSVNNNPNHIIWLSQLNEIFFNIKDFSFCTGEIRHKNGLISATNDMDCESFAKYIKGKRFKVLTNTDGKVAKIDKEYCNGMTYQEIQTRVKSLIDQQNFSEAVKYLQPATQYSLQEL